MKDSISKVEIDVKRLSQNQSIDIAIPQLVQELKQELSSLKALLLSRYLFVILILYIKMFCINDYNK